MGLKGSYVRKIFRKTNISYPLTRTRTCAYQEVRNVSFFGKFCVPTKWMTPNTKMMQRANTLLHVAQEPSQNLVPKPTYLLELNLLMFKKFNKN